MTRIVTLVLGYALLGLGVIGLVVPLLQGVLFLILALVLLAREAPWAKRLLDRLKARYPRLGGRINGAERWTTRSSRRLRVRVGRWRRPDIRQEPSSRLSPY
jgi:membrane protein implicated in regulation of membrane protease activity